MPHSLQACSAPSKQMPGSNPKGDRSSIASISASSTISIPSYEPSASKPRDFNLKREQNPRYRQHNGLTHHPGMTVSPFSAFLPSNISWSSHGCYPVLYDTYHVKMTGSFHGRPDRNDRHSTAPGSLFDLRANRDPRSPFGDRNAGHQYPVAFAAADGCVIESIDCGGHLRHHGFPRGVRARPARGRTDFGSLWPTLAGTDGLCGVLRRQHLVRPRH